MKKTTFEVIRHPETTKDIQTAIDFYNKKVNYLGNEFYAIVLSKLKSLKNDALLYQMRYEDVRCLPIPRFPFMIHYTTDTSNQKVFVHAIINTKKSPQKHWKKRSF